MEPCWGADTQKHSSVGAAETEVEADRQEIWGKQSNYANTHHINNLHRDEFQLIICRHYKMYGIF